MYLSHFGLSEQPFNSPSAIDFFYEGANRGLILDTLVYVLTHGEGAEGIIKVTGEEGSGKTRLCQLLMERLPVVMDTLYLAKRDLSREELLHLIAEKLNFEPIGNSATEPATTAIDELQSTLAARRAAGRRMVLLVDEAHTLPEETLELLWMQYDLQSSHHKFLQIVLFGQPGLKNGLALPPMRKLKDRITHSFELKPFTAMVVKDYLMCRLRMAGYRGPDIFTPRAIKLMTLASTGLIRRLGVLADNTLLAASQAKARVIEAHHVRSAIPASGIKPRFNWRNWRNAQDFPSHRFAGASAVFSVAALMLGVLVWDILHPPATDVATTMTVAPGPFEPAISPPVSVVVPTLYPLPVATPTPAGPSSASSKAPSRSPVETSTDMVVSTSSKPAAATVQPSRAITHIAGVTLEGFELLRQRVEETQKIMHASDSKSFTIQLFATENIQPGRMERFLARARGLIDLSNLYVHPITNGDQAKFVVTYGLYPGQDEAGMAMARLPQKYQTSFQPELHALSEIR